MTVRAFDLPPNGVVKFDFVGGVSNICAGTGLASAEQFFTAWQAWSLTLTADWSGLTWFTPTASTVAGSCGGTWSFLGQFVYVGADQTGAERALRAFVTSGGVANSNVIITKITDWFTGYVAEAAVEDIIPVSFCPFSVPVTVIFVHSLVPSASHF